MGHTVLFQLTLTFIYSTFSKKFFVSAKQADPKQTIDMSVTFFFFNILSPPPRAMESLLLQVLWCVCGYENVKSISKCKSIPIKDAKNGIC